MGHPHKTSQIDAGTTDPALPVLLVIRNSEGEVRWIEVRDELKRVSKNGKKPVKQIVFEGERFDVMSVGREGVLQLGVE